MQRALLPLVIFLLLALLIGVKLGVLPTDSAAEQTGKVTAVIDGDTFVLDTQETVRLIGVDTPELHHPTKPMEYYAEEASAFTRALTEGKKVVLRFDETSTDKYGRTLAYVYLQDGTLVNAELIRQGFSPAYTTFPFRLQDEFVALEEEARTVGVGIWAEAGSGELAWLEARTSPYFQLYPMSRGTWGVRYGSYSRTWVGSKELMQVLETLRIQIYALAPADLEAELVRTGWQKEVIHERPGKN